MATIDLAAHEGFSQSEASKSSDREWDLEGLSERRVGVQGSEGSGNDGEFNASHEVQDLSELELVQRARSATWRPANRRDGGPVAGSA
jgi:hypothetical protein